jgi:hypothetical protein
MGVDLRFVALGGLRLCLAAGNTEYYTGSITKFGADIGYLSSAVMIWAVMAPTTNVGQGALAGHYGGATASAAVAVGAGANVLIGGFQNSIALQPVSIERTERAQRRRRCRGIIAEIRHQQTRQEHARLISPNLLSSGNGRAGSEPARPQCIRFVRNRQRAGRGGQVNAYSSAFA